MNRQTLMFIGDDGKFVGWLQYSFLPISLTTDWNEISYWTVNSDINPAKLWLDLNGNKKTGGKWVIVYF